MRPAVRWTLPRRRLALVAVVAACATTVLGRDTGATIDDIQRQLFKLQQDSAAQASALQEVRAAVEARAESERSGWADLQVKIDGLAHEVSVLAVRFGETDAQLRALIEEVRLARRAPPPPAPAAPRESQDAPGTAALAEGAPAGVPSAGLPPEDLFNRAYADYSRKSYPLAAWQFGEFVRAHPDSALADDAQYWIGECRFAEGDYPGAVEAFQTVIARYGSGDKVAAAHLKVGMAHLELNQIKEALLELQHVMDTYPGSDEARIAREQLRQRGLARN